MQEEAVCLKVKIDKEYCQDILQRSYTLSLCLRFLKLKTWRIDLAKAQTA